MTKCINLQILLYSNVRNTRASDVKIFDKIHTTSNLIFQLESNECRTNRGRPETKTKINTLKR
jgi:hypothetical protein